MRAIVSVSDKTGIVDFARALTERGIEVYSTGGTETLLRDAGIQVASVSALTGSPEILGGRVKTLHPTIHGGLLALRDNPAHMAELAEHGIQPIDLVVVNLYPFLETVRKAGTDLPEALENVDIGGVTLLRAAAKNFASVLVVCEPADYPRVLGEMDREGGASQDTRRRLAARAFQHCAVYDSHVATYLRPHDDIFPKAYTVALSKIADFRAGENPHQLAALYAESTPKPSPAGFLGAEQLTGIPPAFNNSYDADLACQAVADFSTTCVAMIKHGALCGLSLGDTVADAYRKALAADPQSAFGGAIAANRVVDEEVAREIASVFFEDLIAPGFTDEALAILRQRKDLRVFASRGDHQTARGATGGMAPATELDYTRVLGGFLVQTRDTLPEQSFTPNVITQRQPTLAEITALYFGWRAVKHARSHAVVLVRGHSVVGVGAGQASRIAAVEMALHRAGERAQGAVLASDGFFPFPDSLERASEAGVTAVIQPGGAMRDTEIIRAANRHGLAMIYTNERHYRH